jgi:DASS family divalent anion:Na+ symporter
MFMLVLWVFSKQTGIHQTLTPLIGLSLLLLTGILEWRDVLLEHEAWHTFMWLSILVTLSTYLEVFGFIGWFSQSIGVCVQGYSWHTAFLILLLIYYYSHVFFASNTTHVSSMYAAFLGVSLSVGTPPLLAALVLAFFSSLFSSMTHYGTGAAAILYAGNYVPLVSWWRCGFIVSFVHMAIWIGIGGLWWKYIGLW